MAITNLYSNLPGHLVEFKDGGLSLRESTVSAGSKSLLILGTATDGPVNEPVAIDMDTVASLYGEDYTIDSAGNQVPNGTTLTKYARQAYKAGFDDIRCMRVTGTQASATAHANISSETVLEPATETLVANGNKAIVVESSFDDLTVPSNTYPVIDGFSVTPAPKTAVTFTAGDKSTNSEAMISIPANNYNAKSSLEATFNVKYVKENATVVSGALTLGTTPDTDNNLTHEIKVAAADIANLYKYDLSATTLTDTKDSLGVAVVNGLVEVNATSTVNKFVADLKVELDGNNVLTTANNPIVTTNADGDLIIQFKEADPTAFTGSEVVTVSFVEVDSTEEQKKTVTITTTTTYGVIEITPSHTVCTTEDIVLVSADDTNISKYGSGTVIAYDAATNKITIDLTAIPASVLASKYQIGAALKLKYKYEVVNSVTEDIKFITNYAGSLYNSCVLTIEAITNEAGEEGRLISLSKPNSKLYSTNETALQYSSFVYPTFGQLKAAIESTVISPLNNVFAVETEYEDALVKDIDLGGNTVLTINFAGGTDGINPTNDDYFKALSGVRDADGYLEQQGAYQILENYSVDYIYVAGIYTDSTVSSSISKMPQPFHYELALLCAVLTYRTKMTHGFIDVKPNTNTTLVGIQKWVKHLVDLPNEFVMRDADGSIIYDDDQNPMDIGWYTSTVVGPQPMVSSATLGNYYGSAAIAYAAMNASLPSYSAPTNKKVPGCSKMRFKLSNKQMNDLTGNRMVCFKYKNEGTNTATTVPYVVDGCTSGLESSDYARLTTVKVVTQVVDEVREVSDPFIGEPNTVEQRNALAALISKRLSYLKEQGVIQYYEFEITATNYQVLLGECSIALTLVAPQELRKITTVVALKATA